MGFETLVASLAIVTLLAGIGIAVWSKRRTDKMMKKDQPEQPSALARETPDPKFQPDRKATNPESVKV